MVGGDSSREVADLAARSYRPRGILVLTLGLVAFVALSFVWTNRKGHYVREVMFEHESLGDAKQQLPPSWAGVG